MKRINFWMIFQFIELSFQRKEQYTCCETSVVGLLCHSWRLCGGTMESPDCSGTGLERNVLSSVRNLGLSYRSGLQQQDNGPKHAENDTLKRLRAEAFTILECPSLSADLNPFHHLWKELKHAAWRSSLQTCRSGLGCSGPAGAGVSLGGTEIASLHQLPQRIGTRVPSVWTSTVWLVIFSSWFLATTVQRLCLIFTSDNKVNLYSLLWSVSGYFTDYCGFSNAKGSVGVFL